MELPEKCIQPLYTVSEGEENHIRLTVRAYDQTMISLDICMVGPMDLYRTWAMLTPVIQKLPPFIAEEFEIKISKLNP